MGNFSINHFSAIELYPSLVRVVYVLDFAEIPTFQEMQEYQLTVRDDDPRMVAYRTRKARELQDGLVLEVEGRRLPLVIRASTVTFVLGVGGLPTLRLEAVYEAPLEAAHGKVFYEDRNYAERVGWKEIVITGHQGVEIADASVPARSKSNRLWNYAATSCTPRRKRYGQPVRLPFLFLCRDPPPCLPRRRGKRVRWGRETHMPLRAFSRD